MKLQRIRAGCWHKVNENLFQRARKKSFYNVKVEQKALAHPKHFSLKPLINTT